MDRIWMIGIALLLDSLFGDPKFRFHPVRLMGAFANLCERISGKVFGRTILSGVAAASVTVSLPGIISFVVLISAKSLHPMLYIAVGSIMIYFSIAVKDLVQHVKMVYKPLVNDDLATAKINLSKIVSRDTKHMNRVDIIRSTCETLAENYLDSIASPIFYTILLGPIGAVIFRGINTLDAMWGYKSDKYKNFGYAAAKLDDAVNLIPARICAGVMAISALMPGYSFTGSIRTILQDSRKHDSPNSGFPEAAASGALGISFGGNVSYFGKMHQKPIIGHGEPKLSHIPQLITLIYVNTLLVTTLGFLGLRLWYQ
ncbi:MAG: cobalamin biosynthesis protein CobD [Bacteroidetes bacterium]|nr:cobalamin biosynthesis protein CobD [Bacteroidota bacterium]